MKFRMTMKCPDVVDYKIQEMWETALQSEVDEGFEAYEHKMKQFFNQWIEYGEYAVIEFDNVANTANLVFKR